MKVAAISVIESALGTIPKSLFRVGGSVRRRNTSEYHPKYSFIETSQNTEKSPGDLRRLAIAQTPVKDHHLTLV